MKKTKIYKIKGDLDEIVDFFSDLIKFGAVHPLIINVEKIEGSKEGNVFKIYETPFTWIPIEINYLAKCIIRSNTSLAYNISELPFTSVDMYYNFSEEVSQKIEIDVSINIKGKLPGKSILMYKMFKAQDVIMNQLNKLSHKA